MDNDSIKITGDEGYIEVTASLRKGSYAANGYVVITNEDEPPILPTKEPEMNPGETGGTEQPPVDNPGTEITPEPENPVQPSKPDNDQPGTGILYGDADRNGVVDANDALLVLKIAARMTESNPETESIADVDGNKTVDANDALLILQKAAKLIDRFPVEG